MYTDYTGEAKVSKESAQLCTDKESPHERKGMHYIDSMKDHQAIVGDS